MSDNVYERLKARADDESSSVYLEEPVTAERWTDCEQKAGAELGWDGLVWYRSLLEASNGVQIDNAILESAESLITTNLDYRAGHPERQRFLVFGSSGNVDAFVYDREAVEDPFLVANFYGDFARADEVSERYASLESLLSALLHREAGVV